MANMQVTDLSGKWAGRVVGTNVGNLLIEFHQEGRNISGTCRFNDWQYGLAVYKFSGRIDDRIHLTLTPESAPEGVPLAPATDEFALSIEERNELMPSGSQFVFANRVGWARTYLKQAGLLDSPRRGFFRITQRGLDLLQEKPLRIDVNLLERFPEFLEFRARRREKESASTPALTENWL